MARIERQQTVLNILQDLRDLGGLKKLFWEELNYERDGLTEEEILIVEGGRNERE